MNNWGSLYNSRQKLAQITFIDHVKRVHSGTIQKSADEQFRKAVVSYLAIIVDRLADKNSSLVVYDAGWDKISHTFGRQALGMVWDYVEVNPFTNVGWINMQDWVLKRMTKGDKLGIGGLEGDFLVKGCFWISS